jgi:hypothetical protein
MATTWMLWARHVVARKVVFGNLIRERQVVTYIHKYIHTYIHTYIHEHMHTYINTYIHTYLCCYRSCKWVAACDNVRFSRWFFISMSSYIHTYIHTYTTFKTPLYNIYIIMCFYLCSGRSKNTSNIFIGNHSSSFGNNVNALSYHKRYAAPLEIYNSHMVMPEPATQDRSHIHTLVGIHVHTYIKYTWKTEKLKFYNMNACMHRYINAIDTCHTYIIHTVQYIHTI